MTWINKRKKNIKVRQKRLQIKYVEGIKHELFEERMCFRRRLSGYELLEHG